MTRFYHFLPPHQGRDRRAKLMSGLLCHPHPYGALLCHLDIPESEGNIKFGTTILYPGKVGNEFFMTKGHFHEILDTAEIYYCIRGHGYMLMENTEGNVEVQEMTAGISVYVPPGFAHRSINVSEKEPLISFFAYRADAGHDYKTIEMKGFRKLVLEKGGKPDIIDNPKWIK